MIGQTHSRLVWVIIPATQNTGTQFTIPDQPELRYARVTAIEVIAAEALQKVVPGGTMTVEGADLNKLTLVLETNDPDNMPDPKSWNPATKRYQGNELVGRYTSTQQNFKYYPLVNLNRTQIPGVPFVWQLMEFKNVYPTWDKSFIQVVDGGLGNDVDRAVLLNVMYSWLDEYGNPITKN